jgi:predicted enzyme related to lactoylglutathione lyase
MCQAGEHKGTGYVNEAGTLTWSEVYAPDTDKTVAFYGEVLDWGTGSMDTSRAEEPIRRSRSATT